LTGGVQENRALEDWAREALGPFGSDIEVIQVSTANAVSIFYLT
jgi:hypothetical protein